MLFFSEISKHRSDIQNFERTLENFRTRFFADVQLAVLTRLVNDGADSRIICELGDFFCTSGEISFVDENKKCLFRELKRHASTNRIRSELALRHRWTQIIRKLPRRPCKNTEEN